MNSFRRSRILMLVWMYGGLLHLVGLIALRRNDAISPSSHHILLLCWLVIYLGSGMVLLRTFQKNLQREAKLQNTSADRFWKPRRKNLWSSNLLRVVMLVSLPTGLWSLRHDPPWVLAGGFLLWLGLFWSYTQTARRIKERLVKDVD